MLFKQSLGLFLVSIFISLTSPLFASSFSITTGSITNYITLTDVTKSTEEKALIDIYEAFAKVKEKNTSKELDCDPKIKYLGDSCLFGVAPGIISIKFPSRSKFLLIDWNTEAPQFKLTQSSLGQDKKNHIVLSGQAATNLMNLFIQADYQLFLKTEGTEKLPQKLVKVLKNSDDSIHCEETLRNISSRTTTKTTVCTLTLPSTP